MQRQKVIISKNNHSMVKRCILVISLLSIILGIVFLIINTTNNNHIAKVDSESLKAFFSHNQVEEGKTTEVKEESKKNIIKYIAVLEIPSIDLIQGIPYPGKDNTVDRNIQIIEPISLPDMVNGNFILASHSGNSSISYFKHLDKIKENDKVYIYYNNTKYIYTVNNLYLVDKGHVAIRRDHSQNTLTLITCDKQNKQKQLVVITYLDSTQTY